MKYRIFAVTLAPDDQQDRIRQKEVRLTENWGGSPYMPFSAVTPILYDGEERVLNGPISSLTWERPEGTIDWYVLLSGDAIKHVGVMENLSASVNPGALKDRERERRIRRTLADMV